VTDKFRKALTDAARTFVASLIKSGVWGDDLVLACNNYPYIVEAKIVDDRVDFRVITSRPKLYSFRKPGKSVLEDAFGDDSSIDAQKAK
jgi:hypothetical protein